VKNHIKSVIILFFIFIATDSWAQFPIFKTIKAIKGKNNYTVQAITQDHTGFIWLGTDEGLVRFDGINTAIFKIKDSLADNSITAFANDTLGQLWIGHKNGTITIKQNNELFKPFKPDEGLGDKEISEICCDKNGTIWFSTLGEGVYYYKNKRLYNLNTDDGLSDNFCYTIEIDQNNNVWIGTDAGISIYSSTDNSFQVISMKDGLPDNIVKQIVFSKSGDCWIGMEEAGICRIELNTKKCILFSDWTFGSISSLTFADSTHLWIGSKNGLIDVNTEEKELTYTLYTTEEGIIENDVQSVFTDQEGNVWAGTKNGVSIWTGSLFTFLFENHSPSYKNVYSQIIDKNNNIWFCNDNGLFIVNKDEYGRTKVNRLFENTKIGNYKFISIYKAQDNTIWVGTYEKGVIHIDPETLKYQEYNTKNGLTDNNVIHITGNSDYLIFSTLGNGISVSSITNPGQFTNFSVHTGIKSNYIYSSFIDDSNRIWIAQDGGGVSVIQDNKVIEISQLEQLSNVIYGFAQDKNHTIWMLTGGEGLIKFNGKSIEKYTMQSGLSTDIIQSIIFDDNDNLLIISNEGIDILNVTGNTILKYGEENNVAYLEPSLNATYKDKHGDIWIGTSKGMVIYDPAFVSEHIEKPQVLIYKKRLLFNEIPKGEHIFSRSENYLMFDCIGFWYKSPEKLLYRYKMEGNDMDWRTETKSFTAVYSNLNPGEYTFKVEVSYLPGQWISSPDAIYSFTINPPFWQRWWFLIPSFILIILSLYLIYIYKINKLKRDKEILENEVRKRTQVIQEQVEEIQTQVEEIEIQRDEIIQKNKSITDSINYARRIQDAVLPIKSFFEHLTPEIFILFKPKDIVSGDFYWFFKNDHKLYLTAADCTGHGVPGAFMSMLGVALLNEIVSKDKDISSAEILNTLRSKIKSALQQSGKAGEQQDGMDIAFCILDLDTNKLQYAGAHNPILILKNNAFQNSEPFKQELLTIPADNMPIGVHPKERNFTNHEIQLGKDDIFYIYTDGFQSQFGGNKGGKLKAKPFQELLLKNSHRSVVNQGEFLEGELKKWQGEYEQVDDILVIGVKI
jgi:ligand-binding sensor domain-containing protein/serine phosphatase RsbU (regulator of sigma subunit)